MLPNSPLKLKNTRFVLNRTHQDESISIYEKRKVVLLGDKTSRLKINLFTKGIPDRGIPFSRPSRNFFPLIKWKSFPPNNTLWITLYQLLSESKSPTKTIRRLMHSLLRRELNFSGEEALIRLLLDFPDEYFLGAFALRDDLPRRTIRVRLNALLRLRGIEPLSEKEAISSFWNVEVESWKQYSPPFSQQRYSGWKRHQDDKGSISKEGPIELERQVSVPEKVDNLNFIREVISVGILPPEIGVDMNPLKSALMRAETEKFLQFLEEEDGHINF